MLHTRARFFVASVAVLSLPTCSAGAGSGPPLDEGSIGRLEEDVRQALASVREAAGAADAEEAERALAEAERTLERIEHYHVPMLAAGQRARAAYRLYQVGDLDAVGEELDSVEGLLLSMADGADEHLVRELREPLELLGDTRVAVLGEPSAALEAIGELARRLALMLAKEDLVLGR